MPPMSEISKTSPMRMILSITFGIVFVATLAFLIILIPGNSPYPTFFSTFNDLKRPIRPCPEHKILDRQNETLESILTRISINKTLIIAIVNKAYVENQRYNNSTTMLNTFLEGFWLGENTRQLLENLLFVTADRTAYERCRFMKLNCYKMETDDGVDFEDEKIYMSDDFIKMMWRRTELLLDVLKMGFNFIFTDTDVLWLRNPFKNLSNDTNIEFQISLDMHETEFKSNSKHPPLINTGFYFVRSNNKTIALFEKWYSSKDNSAGKKEQDVLLDMIANNIFSELNLTVRYLDPFYFNGFCSKRRDFRVVTTVHANCCRSIRAKVSDLTAVLRDWDVFHKGGNETVSYDWSMPVNCQNSWK